VGTRVPANQLMLQNHSTTTKTDGIIRCYLKPQNNKNNLNLLSQAVEPALLRRQTALAGAIVIEA
jgi:hypothetical protein